MRKILISEPIDFPSEAVGILENFGKVISKQVSREELMSEIEDTDVLFVRIGNYIDNIVLEKAKQLTIIGSPTTGLNHIDLCAAEKKKILVVSLKNESQFLADIRATAELTIGLILMVMRKLPAASRHALESKWNRNLFKGNELYQKTVGIIGLGRLGLIVSKYLSVFDAKVIAFDPNVVSAPSNVKLVKIDELLAESDIVSVHIDYSPKNHHYYSAEIFRKMKKGAWFINTSRGEIVDENSLIENLQNGSLSGAAVDVISNEAKLDIKTNSLIKYAKNNDNLIITPHIGGLTVESLEKVEIFLAKKVANILKSNASRDSKNSAIL